MRTETFETLVTPEMELAIGEVKAEYDNIGYEDVVERIANTPTIDPTENSSRGFVLEPETSEPDEENTAVLLLPNANGWTEHHYIRADVMQKMVFPNNRVIVLPDNSLGQKNYDVDALSPEEKQLASHGSVEPVAGIHLRTLEKYNQERQLGNVVLTGYSKGASIALAMAALGSNVLNISAVNADEAPNKTGRGLIGLSKDFILHGGNLGGAVKDADLKALSSAMRPDRMNIDLLRFGIKAYLTAEGRLMRKSMTDDGVNVDLIKSLGKMGAPRIKVGHVEGSKMFDPATVAHIKGEYDLVSYEGEGFRKHASGDNPIVHGLMVNDGLNLR